jgi:hypothetical protein
MDHPVNFLFVGTNNRKYLTITIDYIIYAIWISNVTLQKG